MNHVLIKYKRTEAQEKKLMSLAMSETATMVSSKACLYNDNLLVRVIDDKGREYVREINRKGELLNTNYWF